MTERKKVISENSIENARMFLDNRDRRTAPNNRVNGYHFMEIANIGADIILAKMGK